MGRDAMGSDATASAAANTVGMRRSVETPWESAAEVWEAWPHQETDAMSMPASLCLCCYSSKNGFKIEFLSIQFDTAVRGGGFI